MFKKLSPFLLLFIMSCTNKENSMNPFLNEYDTPFEIPPFEKIEFKHYEPAFEIGMAEHLKEINDIAQNIEVATFENTIEALERSGKTLDKVANVFYNLLGSNTNDDLDSLAMKISPKLSAHNDSILLNEELFKRIEYLQSNKKEIELTTEQSRLLDETYKRFVRSGANLDQQSMKRLTEINSSLSSLSVQFDQNVLKETNSYSMIVDNQNDLELSLIHI